MAEPTPDLTPAAPYDAARARADIAQREAANARQRSRGRIAAQAGDTESLLGTTRDTALLTLVHLATLAKALSEAQSLAEVRAAAAPLATLTATLLADIDAEEVRLPFKLKGEAKVLSEIGTRATAVAAVLFPEPKGQ